MNVPECVGGEREGGREGGRKEYHMYVCGCGGMIVGGGRDVG